MTNIGQAPTIFEQRAVLEALRPTLSQIHKEYGLQIDSFDLRCTPDGYNAAWAEVKRRFERFVIDKHGVENTLLKDGKLKDESKLMKLERWYGLITEYRFARNWPYMVGLRPCRVENRRGQMMADAMMAGE